MATSVLTSRNPLQPLAGVVTVAFRFTVLAAVLRVAFALLGWGPAFGWGGHLRGSVCMNASAALLQRHGGLTNQALRLRAGASGQWTWTTICAGHAGVAESLTAACTQLPTALLFLGAFYLAQRLVRVAARDGVYTAGVARLLRMLGWWLLLGDVVATLAEAFARMGLLSWLVTWRVHWSQWFVDWSVSWPVIFTGLGVITLARVLRLGVTMREDLEGTV